MFEKGRKGIEEIHTLNLKEKHESPTIIEVREIEQYGIHLSLENETFERLREIAKKIIDKTKTILEE